MHAILAPSSAPQWGVCSGSVEAQRHAPDIEHPRTRAGTASHWVGSECLLRWQDIDGGVPFCSEWIGRTAPNGVVIDEEMAEGAQVFVDHVLGIAQQHGALQDVLIEHRVFMPRIHPTANWGTLDACVPLLDRDKSGRVAGGKIYVIDYKFGHREVKAAGNLQLIDYVEGILNEFSIDGHAEQFIEVILQVVQPFCYQAPDDVNEWRGPLTSLRPYFNQLEAKAWEVFNKPTLSTGPHCRDCRAILVCSAARKAHYSLVDYVNAPLEFDRMTGRDMAVERAILLAGRATLQARLDAIEEALQHRISKGETDSGLTVEAGQGRLAWTVPKAQAIAFGAQFGLDLAKPDVLTPTQAISAAKGDVKKIFAQAIESITNRPPTGLKLIDAADSKTARAFKKGK